MLSFIPKQYYIGAGVLLLAAILVWGYGELRYQKGYDQAQLEYAAQEPVVTTKVETVLVQQPPIKILVKGEVPEMKDSIQKLAFENSVIRNFLQPWTVVVDSPRFNGTLSANPLSRVIQAHLNLPPKEKEIVTITETKTLLRSADRIWAGGIAGYLGGYPLFGGQIGYGPVGGGIVSFREDWGPVLTLRVEL